MTKATMRLSVALLACLLLALPVAAKDIARVSVSAGELVFTPEAAVAGYQLTVTGPGGYLYTETFDGSGAMTWAAQAADGGLLANGAYSYELRPVAHQLKRGSVGDLELGKPELTALSGTVTVRGGSLVNPDQREEPLTKDVVHNDDVIITGSLCVGFDCVNGESFGFDTVRLKENNLRIKFDDTSTAGGFPANDWQLTANDSASGGANKFSIDDISGGRTPFTIEAGAPSHSLYVDDGGRVGLGTSTPVVELHVVDGDSPTLRLQQDGSSGFTPQTWDVAGNETNFFVRDATNGSTLPFKIFPNAPTNSLTIEKDTGDIGIGTQSPDADLDIEGDGPTIRWTNTGSGGTAWDFKVGANNGNLTLTDDTTAARIPVKINNSAVNNLFRVGSVNASTVDVNGTFQVTGSVVVNGTTVHPDYVFDSDYQLESIADHAALMWQEKHLPALPKASASLQGPVNLVEHQMGILEELEKAHIYIEQLHDSITEQRETLTSQQELIQQLTSRLAALEKGN